MSGGYFNYNEWTLQNLVDEMEDALQTDWAQTLSPETKKKIQEGIFSLQESAVYVKRIDYLFEGDDAEQTFHNRIKEDLTNLHEQRLQDPTN